jgi:hypothetical protein
MARKELDLSKTTDELVKEIIEDCIEAYSTMIVEMQNASDQSHWRGYLSYKFTSLGVCNYIYHQFGILPKAIDETIEMIYQRYLGVDGYWFKPPFRASSKDEATKLLEKRLEILKLILCRLETNQNAS